MVIDYHAKSQLNICKCLEKKCGKLFDRWYLVSPRSLILPNSVEHNEIEADL